MESSTEVLLKCLFCFSTSFELPEENYQPQLGELIRCSNCGKLNDYNSLIRVARKKGAAWAEEQAQKVVNDFLKQIETMFK